MIEKLTALNLNVISGERISADYCHDEYPGGDFCPEAVVEASSTEEVAVALKFCNENDISVTVRGAGTGQVGGSVPVKGGIVLSVKGMNRVLDIDKENKLLRVQSGVLLKTVKETAESVGLFYPPDPGEQTATIGGNAATNAAGPCAVKYGGTKDYVLDAVIVLADGTVTSLHGNEVVIGSEGTMGVITELTLKLIDKPKADAVLLFPFHDTEGAVCAAKAIISNGFEPTVVEYMDTDLVEFSGNITGNPVFPVRMDGARVASTLMVSLEGADDDELMEKMESIACMAEEGKIECLDILVGDSITMKREFWTAHAAFHTSIESGAKSAWEANVDIPIDMAAQMIEFAKDAAKINELKALIHAHLGSGGMHIHAVSEKKRNESAADAKAFFDAVYTKCVELGGNIIGEYGIGYAKTAYLEDKIKVEFKMNKSALDPKGILNPGKVVAE